MMALFVYNVVPVSSWKAFDWFFLCGNGWSSLFWRYAFGWWNLRILMVSFLLCLCAEPLMAQFYSYRGPDGKMHITDRPIKRKGYKLMKRYIPPAQREEMLRRKEEERRQSSIGKTPKAKRKHQLSAKQIAGLVDPIAKAYGVDPDLVKAVIRVESSNNYKVVSSKGAMGLMQLIPATAERFGVKNPWDPRQNVKGGIKYLRWLLAYFEGNVDHALAAYNAGENAVDKYRGVPPYKETKRYLVKVRKLYKKERLPYDKKIKHRSKMLRKAREAPQVARAE